MSAAHLSTLTPLLATAGIGVLYYRRIRRQFGRQPYQPKRAMARVVLLSLLLCGLVVSAVRLPNAGLAIGAGLLCGSLLGMAALRLTGVESSADGHWYTPNPWIGGALSLLLVGRLAWRWSQGGFAAGTAQAQHASPLTLGLMAALVAFYVVNGVGLALRVRALQPDRRPPAG